MASTSKGLVVLSGGMDSATAAYWAVLKAEMSIECISFDYGQRHKKELDYAAKVAAALNAPHDIVDLSDLRNFLTGSALTDNSVDVPEGHYADETMKSTVVPNRNMIMLSIATGIAVARGIPNLIAGMHAGDHPIYPDCRPEFVASFGETVLLATAGILQYKPYLKAPFLYYSKADIVAIGSEMQVPYELTWSCYKGGYNHCGKCGTCVERKEAFELAGVADPTVYDA